MKRLTSPARAAASRANGSKTRGPVTPAGKYNSSLNAVRHGLLSRFLVLPGSELPGLFEDLYSRFHADLSPRNDVERALVEEMVTSWWRKRRVWGMESARIAYQVKVGQAMGRPVPVDDPATATALAVGDLADNSRVLDLYLRYETRFERQFHRALHRLLDLRRRDPQPPDNTIFPNEPEQLPENTALDFSQPPSPLSPPPSGAVPNRTPAVPNRTPSVPNRTPSVPSRDSDGAVPPHPGPEPKPLTDA